MSATNFYIPIILGTAREGRKSENVAKYILNHAKNADLESEILDVRDYRLVATDDTETAETAKRFEGKVSRADGFIIVSPEYNHGYPGELKMMLDMLYDQYARKPVGICGVSKGMLGGARMVEQLRLICIAFHMVPIGEAIYFSKVNGLFDEGGNIKDESYGERARRFLEELIWYANVLKAARGKELK